MYRPPYIVIDFETALLDGTPSVEMYRHDFRVTSCAFMWRGENGEPKSKATYGEDETGAELEKIFHAKIPCVVHNFQFEWGVIKCRFGGLESIVHADTMRLTQLCDNGSTGLKHEMSFEDELDGLEGFATMDGLSLEACASRFLERDYYKHKKPYVDLMIERGGKKGDFHLLTKEELTTYNLMDVEVTLKLYEELNAILKDRKIDWERDHYLYRSTCRLITQSKIRGVKVDFQQIDRHIDFETSNINEVERKFREAVSPQIERIEARKAQAWIEAVKSPNGRAKREEQVRTDPPEGIKFKLSSNKDKEALFIDELGLTAKFFTKGGSPSFSAKLLWQYGEIGRMLEKLGTHRISLSQAESLKELAEYDGRWHIDMRTTGTKTGRLSGGYDG